MTLPYASLSKVTRHFEEQPDTRLATQIQDLFKEQRDAQLKDHEAIKAVIKAATAPLTSATPPTGTRVVSWAQVAATAGPPPGHVTPPHTMLSSGSSSTLTAYKGREVTVKLLDHALAQRLRQLSPSQLKNKVNNILRETPKVGDIKIASAHQLKSGDITIITNSLDEATELQTHTDWARGLGPRAGGDPDHIWRDRAWHTRRHHQHERSTRNYPKNPGGQLLRHSSRKDYIRRVAHEGIDQETELFHSDRIHTARNGQRDHIRWLPVGRLNT